jgi:hypothetical protein
MFAHEASASAIREISILPPARNFDKTTDKYMFIDTRQVVEDMKDLGFEVAGFRRPGNKPTGGAYGLHEVDFRRSEDMNKALDVAPRVLFLNSYDGTKKAQIISGIIRWICSNGLIAGDIYQHDKFIHMGFYEEQLLDYIRSSAQSADKVFGAIDRFKTITLDPSEYRIMAERAGELRFGNTNVEVKSNMFLMPRRLEDARRQDLWTVWNRVQENVMRGGLPTVGSGRFSRPLADIQKSNQVNVQLWDLLEEFAGHA